MYNRYDTHSQSISRIGLLALNVSLDVLPQSPAYGNATESDFNYFPFILLHHIFCICAFILVCFSFTGVS